MKLSRFAAYAWGVLGYNLLVVLWGAYVRATGSGAGCGDHWPLCNGEVIPRPDRIETMIELTHRLTSGLALLAVVGMLVWAWRAYPAGHRVRLGARLSMIFIVLEALLGAGLVLFELVAENASSVRAFSMIAHLVNTFFLIAILALTAWWATGAPAPRLRGAGRTGWALAVGFVGLLLVGASGAIAALGDTLFPSPTLREGLLASFSAHSHPFVQLRKFHPVVAIVVGAVVAATARRIARTRPAPATTTNAALVQGLYAAQLVVGAANVALLAPVWLQLVHLLLADLVWIALVLLASSALAPLRASAVIPAPPRSLQPSA